MKKLSNTIKLLGAAKQVLIENKKLLFIPVLSVIACLFVVGTPIAVIRPYADAIERSVPADSDLVFYGLCVFLFLLLYLVMLTGIFFNAVLIVCADTHLRGEAVSFRRAFASVAARLPALAGWIFISCSIGMILRVIEEKSHGLTSFFTGLLGVSFTVSSFLVVPVIVLEKTGPINALKRSGNMFLKVWGEEIISDIGFTFVWIALSLPFLVSAGFLGAGDRGAGWWAYGVSLFAASLFVCGMCIAFALLMIFKTVLYRFTCHNEVSGAYTPELLKGVVKPR